MNESDQNQNRNFIQINVKPKNLYYQHVFSIQF